MFSTGPRPGASRALVTPKVADHVCKLLAMCSSPHDGEALNAARLAHQFIRQMGLTWRDIISAPPEWQSMVRACRQNMHLLNEREREFIENISRWRHPPSVKQFSWLTSIFERISS